MKIEYFILLCFYKYINYDVKKNIKSYNDF